MSTQTWKRIRRQAMEDLETPDNGHDDPEKAVEAALISVQRERIKKETQSLPPLNGRHKKDDK